MLLAIFIAVVCYSPIIETFVPSTNFGAGIPDLGPVRLGIYLLSLVFIIHIAIAHKIRFNRFFAILAAFYLIVLASVSWSNYSYRTSTLQEFFGTVFIPLFVALVSINLFTQEHNKKSYIRHIVIASVILAVMSIFQTIVAILTQQEAFRARGTFGNANSLAIFLILTIPCILYALENRFFPRILGWVILFSVFIGTICTVSRKGIATMALCFILFSLLKKKYKQIAIFLYVFALLAGLFSGYVFFSKRFDVSELQHHFQQKWNMTVAGWRMFQTSPIAGLGYKGYYDNYGKFCLDAWRDKYDAHNIFITALANYGLLGFLPFMGIFMYPLIISIRTIRREESLVSTDYSRDWAIVCICSIIPFMINGWFAGGLFYSTVEVSLLYINIMLFLCGKS